MNRITVWTPTTTERKYTSLSSHYSSRFLRLLLGNTSTPRWGCHIVLCLRLERQRQTRSHRRISSRSHPPVRLLPRTRLASHTQDMARARSKMASRFLGRLASTARSTQRAFLFTPGDLENTHVWTGGCKRGTILRPVLAVHQVEREALPVSRVRPQPSPETELRQEVHRHCVQHSRAARRLERFSWGYSDIVW